MDQNNVNHLHDEAFWASCLPGEEIVITGISGAFPKSKNVQELKDNLFEKVDMTQANKRWDLNLPENPPRMGAIPEIDKYDAGYFGVHERQSHSIDAQYRILQEKAMEAIFDAGLHLVDLENTRTGVFIATSTCETIKPWVDSMLSQSYAITGFPFSMAANRLSYFLKLKGPSCVIDTACSSSLHALEHAFKAIRLREIDRAIVGATNLCMQPYYSIQLGRLGVLGKDGCCKVFDNSANGYVRAEAIAVVFLQKSKDAKRIYAQVVHVKSNSNGYMDQGISFPFREGHKRLYKELYEECRIDPYSLTYMEAHGTGTVAGDLEECEGIDDIFTKNRTAPLLIGSLKSNCGHTEPVSGLCGLIKCIISMEAGVIPPNIHFITPRAEVKGLIEGRLKVVTEPTPLEDDKEILMALNNFGLGGANCHVLLRRISKKKIGNGSPADDLERLVCVSGRTEEAVTCLLDGVSTNKFDTDHIKLIHNVFRQNIQNHLYRGYIMVSKTGETHRSLKYCPQNCRPLHFAFGELHNWWDIGSNLMALPVFADTIKRIDEYVSGDGINISDTLLNKTLVKDFNSVLGTVAVQTGIIHILNLLEIKATNTTGYSLGTLLSTYYDGIMDLEETISCALVLDEFAKKLNYLPNHKTFQKNERKPHRRANSNNLNRFKSGSDNFRIALKDSQSTEISQLLHNLTEVLERSKLCDNEILNSKYRSASCIINAMTSNYFQNTRCIKQNAVILKIGEGPLENNENCIVSLPNSDSENYLEELLKTIGGLYECGYNPQIDKLYPPVNLPVSRGTRMISPYIKWNHRRHFFIPHCNTEDNIWVQHGTRTVTVQLSNDRWSYIDGHIIDGRNLFPATGYLYLVWETYKIMNEADSKKRIVLEDCKFKRATIVPKDEYITLSITIQKCSGNFEVVEGESSVVTGRIYATNNEENEISSYQPTCSSKLSTLSLKTKDIYKEFRLRGYYYRGGFRAIQESDSCGTQAYVKWDNNWVTFLDNMLQMKLLELDSRLLLVPIYISKVSINSKNHLEWINTDYINMGKAPIVPVINDHMTGTIRCGGIYLSGVIVDSISRRKNLATPLLESYTFVPNYSDFDTEQSLRINMQIILENNFVNKFKVIEVIDEFTGEDAVPLTPIICLVFDEQPITQVFGKILSKSPLDVSVDIEDKHLRSETDCHLVIASNILGRPEMLRQIFASLKENGFIMSRETIDFDISRKVRSEITIITMHKTPTETLLLFQKQTKTKELNYVKINSNNFSWISKVKRAIKKNIDQHIVLYSINEPDCGILGLITTLRREPETENLRCLFLQDETEQTDVKTYEDQLKKNMAINVFKNGQWGTYRFFPLDRSIPVKSEHCVLGITAGENLSSLKWTEGPLRYNMVPPTETELVHVHYAALNFRDIMVALGKIKVDFEERINQQCVLGFEYSGTDSNGNRVCGLTKRRALSSLVLVNSYSIFKIPDTWSLEEAATVPVVYMTVIYCLIIRGRLKRGETVLIHAGSGGVGQAAIQLALHYGCRVYTTVSSQAKRDFLKETYNQLEDNHIGNSRDDSFEQMIYRETNGQGVDLVLNSLAEDKLLTSVRCLARGGRFIEIGKFDLANNNRLSLLLYQKEASFHGVMLDQVLSVSPQIKKEMNKIFNDLIKTGAIKPLNKKIFKYHEVEEAFRYMANGKHLGKVLIQVRKPEETSIQKFPGTARYVCDSDKTYIIIGGLGGMGLELADWLVLRGATKLVLTSRKGISTGYQDYRIRQWRSYGTIVKVSKAVITSRAGCKQLIEESLELGPIEAIFNLALVLNDSIFENQTPDSFISVFEPKAFATKYMDELTRTLCPNLREFVVFSSIASSRRNAGQTNYAMANSVMERICEKRKQDGYPALAIQWGGIGEVGVLAEMYEEQSELVITGCMTQHISSCLEVLDTLLKQKEAVIVSSVVVASKREVNETDNIVELVIAILGMPDAKSISLHATLAELGLDSITSVEIKLLLEREYGIFLSLKEIRTITLARLKELSEGEHEVETSVQEYEFEKFFRLIGNESESHLPYIKLNSKVDEKSTAPKLLLFPGIEGCAKILEPLATHLDAHTVCIQFGFNAEDQRIAQTAKSLVPTVEEHLQKEEPFHIVAYSYGALIALEVVHILESQGYIGTITCIDGAPLLVNEMIKRINMEPKHAFETSLMCYFISFYTTMQVVSKQRENLLKCKSWEERVRIGLEITKNCPDFNADYQTAIWNGMYNRLKAAATYTPTYRKLKSNIKLYKPKSIAMQGLPDDYGLSHLSENPVEVRILEGDHSTILDNRELAEGVNSLMGEKNING